MARSTGDEPVEGEVCYVPSRYAAGTSTLFDTPDAARGSDAGADPVTGRIVLTEGFSMPGPVQAFERRGAIAQIYIHPGAATFTKASARRSGARRRPSRSAASRRRRWSASIIRTARRSSRRFERGAVRAEVTNVAARRLDALPAAGRRDPRARAIPTSSCSCTATTIPGTRASATTRPATPRSSSWRACCGASAIA